MIEVNNMSVRYGAIRALSGASLTVGAGEFVALIGANGAGKSTLLKGLIGVEPLAEGDIHFLGQRVTRLSTTRRVRRGMGMVPESRQLFPTMTVLENLTLGAFQYLGRLPRPPRDDLERVLELFPRLRERLSQDAGTLSGGEQQMLALGRALMGRPRILICDEPSTGLAPILVAEILSSLRQLCDEGLTVLLAEQNAVAALEVSDRAYVLENGEVVLDGIAKHLLDDPAVVSAYLGESAG